MSESRVTAGDSVDIASVGGLRGLIPLFDLGGIPLSARYAMRGRVHSRAQRTQRAWGRIACTSSPLAKV
jgi:hypothetical protein